MCVAMCFLDVSFQHLSAVQENHTIGQTDSIANPQSPPSNGVFFTVQSSHHLSLAQLLHSFTAPLSDYVISFPFSSKDCSHLSNFTSYPFKKKNFIKNIDTYHQEGFTYFLDVKQFNKCLKPNIKYSQKFGHLLLFLNSRHDDITQAIARTRNLHVFIDNSLFLYPTLQILINFCQHYVLNIL